ncbi:hypothetical protein ACFL6X_09235 [Candidatus Latescibacterota bacterium]
MPAFGRVVFWLGLAIIVGHHTLYRISTGEILLAIGGLLLLPLTYFMWPFYSGLWWLLFVSLAGYWMSTTGRMRPVD